MSEDPKVSENMTEKEKAEQTLASVDQMLNVESPGFVESLDALKKDESFVKVEIISENQTRLQMKVTDWKNKKGLSRTLYKVIPFLPHIALACEIAIERFRSFLRWNLVQLKVFSKATWIYTKKKAIQFFKYLLKKIKNFFARLGRLSKLQQALSYLSIIGIIAGFVLLFISYKDGIIPKEKSMYMKSFAEVAAVESYSGGEMEKLYDNFRIKKYIVEVPKMVVNLRRTDESLNPMLAFDLYIECSNDSCLVEIKDRMYEVKDLVQRDVEQMIYEQLSSTEGKNRFREKIKNTVNQMLTTGRVRRVLFKTFVLKPL